MAFEACEFVGVFWLVVVGGLELGVPSKHSVEG